MGKATRPVSINGIEFDALIDETRTLDSTVPEYSVESGFSVSDAIILNPEKLSMTLFVTNTPVTWHRQHGGNKGRVADVCKQLEELYYTGEPVTITTSDATYSSMAIESLTLGKKLETGYSREIPISFKKIRVTSAKSTTIPDSYGKSGKSTASAGTASTSNASGASSNANGSGGAKSASSGGGSGGGNKKSSVLYGAASSMGLI